MDVAGKEAEGNKSRSGTLPPRERCLSLEPKCFVIIGAKVQNFGKTSQFKLPAMRQEETGPYEFPAPR